MLQQKDDEERLKIILKAQGLHKFAKMSLNIGKQNMEKIVKLTRYAQYLARPRTYAFMGIKDPMAFMDDDTLNKVMYDPIFGFVWYYQEKGEMETFGNLLLKGEASDAALGTASEVGAVISKGKGEMPEVLTKKELGMDDKPPKELLKDYRKIVSENEMPTEIPSRVVDTEPPIIDMMENKATPQSRLKILAPWKRSEEEKQLKKLQKI